MREWGGRNFACCCFWASAVRVRNFNSFPIQKSLAMQLRRHDAPDGIPFLLAQEAISHDKEVVTENIVRDVRLYILPCNVSVVLLPPFGTE